MGEVIDLYLYVYLGDEKCLYHLELGTGGKDKEEAPILLSPTATFDPDVIGRNGDWTVCGEHIYWSGGLDDNGHLFPELFKHNTSGLKKWLIQRQRNHRPFPLRNIFAAADVDEQKLYFMGGFYWGVNKDPDRYGYPKLDGRCGECLDLDTLKWSSLVRNTITAQEISSYNPRTQVAAKVRNAADEPMEIVYYSAFAGSILFLNVTDGGSCRLHVVDDSFALFRCGPADDPPQVDDPSDEWAKAYESQVHDPSDEWAKAYEWRKTYMDMDDELIRTPQVDDHSDEWPKEWRKTYEYRDMDMDDELIRTPKRVGIPPGLEFIDISELIESVASTRAVVTKNRLYWLTFDLRLFAYCITSKRWLEPVSLSHHLPPPFSEESAEDLMYPLLLGLPKHKMVVIIMTSPGELTAAYLEVHEVSILQVKVKGTQAYSLDLEHRNFLISGGEALLRSNRVRPQMN